MKITNYGEVATGVGGASSTGASAGGDLDGTFPGPTVTGLLGDPIEGTPGDGNVLQFHSASGHWTLVAPPAGPPAGPAGGDLSGTYPDPTARLRTQAAERRHEVPKTPQESAIAEARSA